MTARTTSRRALLSIVRAVVASAALVVASSAAARVVPLSIEMDGCVLPAPACAAVRDVVTLNVGDQKLSFAVEEMRLRTSSASTSRILTEMKLRPTRVHGPDELVHKLVPGAHVRVRGGLRVGDRYLMVMAVDPLGEQPQ